MNIKTPSLIFHIETINFKEIFQTFSCSVKTSNRKSYEFDCYSEWHRCMEECSSYQMPYQLRMLFVTILMNCEVSKPLELFDSFTETLMDDILYQYQQAHNFRPEINSPGTSNPKSISIFSFIW